MATFITLFGLSLTWVSITLALNGQMYWSFLLALGAFVADCLDGLVARLQKTDSQIGRQLDNLSDAVLYLLWPALVCFRVLGLTDPLSLLSQSVFLSAGLYRLARFNVLGYVPSAPRVTYPGIPVIFSFMTLAILFILRLFWPHSVVWVVSVILLILHAVLMVSRIDFPKISLRLSLGLLISALVVFAVYGRVLF